jgi:hypothetical protein
MVTGLSRVCLAPRAPRAATPMHEPGPAPAAGTGPGSLNLQAATSLKMPPRVLMPLPLPVVAKPVAVIVTPSKANT